MFKSLHVRWFSALFLALVGLSSFFVVIVINGWFSDPFYDNFDHVLPASLYYVESSLEQDLPPSRELAHIKKAEAGKDNDDDDDMALSQEVQRILSRVDTCLDATNMTQKFRAAGYYAPAKEHAEQFIRNLRTVIPQNFSAKYSSPCWDTDFQISMNTNTSVVDSRIGNKTFRSNSDLYKFALNYGFLAKVTKERGTFKSSVACLPKIFQMGAAKSGTSFLYCLMTRGLGMRPGQITKELHWWERWPQTDPSLPNPKHIPQPNNIPVYLMNFAHAYESIAAGDSQFVTVDGSPNAFQDVPAYYMNEPPVNYCLLPAIIPEVLPDSKFVITLRNPVEMVYSAFLYTCNGRHMPSRTPDIFHERIMKKLNQFEDCMKNSFLDWCARNITYEVTTPELTCGDTRVAFGIYYINVRRWLSVTSPKQFLFLTTEEVTKNTNATGRRLWDFMGYPGDFKGVSASVCSSSTNSNSHRNKPVLKMRLDTREILKNFFKPYNKLLAKLLDNKKFLWEENN